MSLIRNSIYNIAGFAIPTIIAIPALGILARLLGVESFGLFTLAFAIVGYASIFDGGITRAVIREISIFRDNEKQQRKIIATSTLLIIILSLAAALFLYFSSKQLVIFLRISPENSQQAQMSFKLLSLIIPIYLINQIWLAFLEGNERFLNINFQRIISSTLVTLFPVIFCFYKADLVYAILGLIAGRYLSFILTFSICYRIIIKSGLGFDKVVFSRLFTFGGWLTVSNIISPIMVYFDRFIISNIMGASKVAFYTAPAEVVARLNNIPFSLARALFPKLIYTTDFEERRKLERLSYALIGLVCAPIVIFVFYFSEIILVLWLGGEYAGKSSQVLQILMIGFFCNALAQVPFSLLQADGKSKITALVHVFEVMPYAFVLYYLTDKFGIIGTAFAWSLRTFLDLILMFVLSRKK